MKYCFYTALIISWERMAAARGGGGVETGPSGETQSCVLGAVTESSSCWCDDSKAFMLESPLENCGGVEVKTTQFYCFIKGGGGRPGQIFLEDQI